MSGRIVVLGSCSVDYTTYAPRLPLPGETIHGTKFATSFGGKGANQCVAAAKLHDKVTMIARVGDDSWGKAYVENVKKYGVDVTHMKITEGAQTGVAQITVDDAGENHIVIVEGANKQLSIRDVDDAKDILTEASVLICQLETPIGPTLRAFQLCKGIKILNAAPALENIDEEFRSLLSLTTVLCVNETEAAMLTGKSINDVGGGVDILTELLKFGCERVIVTLGAKGAILSTRDNPEAIHVSAPPNIQVIDTTGAGDAFVGTLGVSLASDPHGPLEEMARKACRAASASTTREGTQDSFVDRQHM